jgi:hypothetical protein
VTSRAFHASTGYHLKADSRAGTIPNGSVIFAQTDEGGYDDISVSVDVRNISASGSVQGCVTVRADSSGAFAQSENLCIDGASQSTAAYTHGFDNGRYVRTDLMEPLARSGARSPSDWNTLRIEADGTQLRFFVNDQLLGTSTVSGALDGAVGIQVVAMSGGVGEFEFRNLVVRKLED